MKMDACPDNAVDHQGGFVTPPITDHQKNVVIGGVLLAMLLAALDQTIVTPAMPTIANALGNAEYLPWIVTAYLLTATAMAPLYGKLSDIHGRRPIIYIILLIFLAGSLVCALADNMFVLILGRAVQGLGGGGLFTLSQTVIGDLVPPFERARYAAWNSGVWAVASIAGPLLGGALSEYLHWSLVFWINIPLGLLVMAIINAPLKKLPMPGHRHNVDGWGALVLIVATALLLLTLNWGGGRYPWLSAEIFGLAGLSAVCWAAFGLRLLSAAEPLISLEVLKSRVVLAGTLAILMLQAANIGLAVYLPVYLQSCLELSASRSGTALLGLLLGTVIGASASGRLIPRFVHYKRIALFGMALSCLSLALLGIVAASAPLLLIEVLTICAGIGAGTGFPVATVSVQNAVDRTDLGVATGVLTFLRSFGGALGVAVLGTIALSYRMPLGERASSAHIMSAAPFIAIFFACAAMTLASFTMFLVMPEKALRRGPQSQPQARR